MHVCSMLAARALLVAANGGCVAGASGPMQRAEPLHVPRRAQGAVDPPAYTRNLAKELRASVRAALPEGTDPGAALGLLTRAPHQMADPDFDPELVEMNEALHR